MSHPDDKTRKLYIQEDKPDTINLWTVIAWAMILLGLMFGCVALI